MEPCNEREKGEEVGMPGLILHLNLGKNIYLKCLMLYKKGYISRWLLKACRGPSSAEKA